MAHTQCSCKAVYDNEPTLTCPKCHTVHWQNCEKVYCWDVTEGDQECFVERGLFDAEVMDVRQWDCCGFQEKRS